MSDATDFSWVQLILAFSVVMALLACMGLLLKYVNERGISLPGKFGRKRRMKLVESLTVDAKRRAVILDCDGRQHLLLLTPNQDIVIQTNLPPPDNDSDGL